MELPCTVVVEDLREHPWVTVEEVLVQDGVIVGQRLGQSGEARGRNLLQGGFISLMADAANIKNDPIIVYRCHGFVKKNLFHLYFT